MVERKEIMNQIKKRSIFLVLTIILSLGISLASVYFIYTHRDSRENKIATALVSLDFKEKSDVINLTNNVPVIDEVGITNTPYEFTITNTSLIAINVDIKLNVDETATTIKNGAVKYALYINDEFIKKDYVQNDNLTLYTYEYLNAYKDGKLVGETIHCKLIFWVDYYYDNPNETFKAKVEVEGRSIDAFEGEYVKINYIEDLVDLSNAVNSGTTYSGVNFVLMRDLDFKNSNSYRDASNVDYGDINGDSVTESIKVELTKNEEDECTNCGGFIPIGYDLTNSFQGTFNGRDYTISNLYENNINHHRHLGLFGYVLNSNISNLSIDGKMMLNYLDDTNQTAAGLIGITKQSNIINNCSNGVNITSNFPDSSVGGLVGTNANGTTSVLQIINSSNSASLQNGNFLGGLIGYNGGKLTIKNSYNEGDITNSKGNYVGGLIGGDNVATTENPSDVNIINSYNKGTIKNDLETSASNKYLGGIAGRIRGTFSIKDSYNESNVISTINNTTSMLSTGGLIGYLDNGTIKNCYNKGNVTNQIVSSEIDIALGGIVGRAGKSDINNSYNIGIITGGNRVGGIVGATLQNAEVTILESYNTGNINSETTIISDNNADFGGIVGLIAEDAHAILNKTSNTGNITYLVSGNESNVGGIVGLSYKATANIINSYNTGNMTSYQSSNGIIFETQSNVILINNYNIGTITSSTLYSSGIARLRQTNNKYVSNVYNIGNISSNNNSNISGISYIGTDVSNLSLNNAYYTNTISSGVNGQTSFEQYTTPMNLNDMKSQTFVNTLNNNLNSINLSNINGDTSLKDYKLSKWKLGKDQYPVLDWQK